MTFKAYFGIVNKVATYVSERTHREADRVLRDIKQSLSATVAPTNPEVFSWATKTINIIV